MALLKYGGDATDPTGSGCTTTTASSTTCVDVSAVVLAD